MNSHSHYYYIDFDYCDKHSAMIPSTISCHYYYRPVSIAHVHNPLGYLSFGHYFARMPMMMMMVGDSDVMM